MTLDGARWGWKDRARSGANIPCLIPASVGEAAELQFSQSIAGVLPLTRARAHQTPTKLARDNANDDLQRQAAHRLVMPITRTEPTNASSR